MKDHRSSSRSLLVVAVVTAIAGIAAAVLWLRGSSGDEPVPPPAAPTQLSGAISANPFAQGKADAPPPAEPAPPAPSAPSALAETGSGVFRTDSNGTLLLDETTRLRLDMLLSNLSKNPTLQELQAVEAEAVAGLPATVAQQALPILHTYIAYKSALDELAAAQANGPAVTPEEMLDRLVTLRRRHLGQEIAQALFGKQELQERYGLQLAALEEDTSLTVREKQARIGAMLQALPADATELRAMLESRRAALSMEQGTGATMNAQEAAERQQAGENAGQ
ncbi:hypothetical protein GCM10027343_15930 [Noviherbaspirillum agri]